VVVENGLLDELVTPESRELFHAEMQGAGVDYRFTDHAGAPHGFALPPSLGPPGCLHEAADRRSTESLLALLRELFPVPQSAVGRNAAGTAIPDRAALRAGARL